ncbi:MAG: DUF1501 domain-containing protein [Gemmataceae bacterium]
MLRILGSTTRLCDGLTRREALRAGGLGLLGLTLADLDAGAAPGAASLRRFGQAKSCILLYLYGAPSQLETFDLKPEAPDDVRSQFRPIATSVPGVQICEHLPRTARVMHRATLIRSLTSPYNIHNVAYALSGVPTTDIPMELNPRDTRHWPCFGSVLDYLATRGGQHLRDLPTQVALPWKFSSRSEPFRRGGPFGGFLGTGYDPVWAEFHGQATKGDPFVGIAPKMRFQVSQPGAAEITLDRLDQRRSLLQQFDRARARLLDSEVARGFDRQQQMALRLVSSSKMGRALDVEREPHSLRERYGFTLFGQSVLAARRLIEAGVRLTTVFWDEFREANSAWDTHVRQETRLRDELCPGFDLAYSALLDDLEVRGLLDETLVVVLSEHGRTPKLNKTPGGGREHWGGAFSALLAGGGVRRGQVLGATDRIAAFPKDYPVSPKDVLATIYHLLGVDPATHLHDREGRPVGLVPGGKVIEPVLA